MAVTARFYVSEITKFSGGTSTRIKLGAACRGPENRDWARWSPSGTVELVVLNPPAVAWFEERIGKDVAITFEDRDPICDKCHEEISDPSLGSSSFDSEGKAVFVHANDCSAK